MRFHHQDHNAHGVDCVAFMGYQDRARWKIVKDFMPRDDWNITMPESAEELIPHVAGNYTTPFERPISVNKMLNSWHPESRRSLTDIYVDELLMKLKVDAAKREQKLDDEYQTEEARIKRFNAQKYIKERKEKKATRERELTEEEEYRRTAENLELEPERMELQKLLNENRMFPWLLTRAFTLVFGSPDRVTSSIKEVGDVEKFYKDSFNLMEAARQHIDSVVQDNLLKEVRDYKRQMRDTLLRKYVYELQQSGIIKV